MFTFHNTNKTSYVKTNDTDSIFFEGELFYLICLVEKVQKWRICGG